MPPSNHERHLMRQVQRAQSKQPTICNECGEPSNGALFCGAKCATIWFAKHDNDREQLRQLTLKYATKDNN